MALGSNHYTKTLGDTNKFLQDIWTKWLVVEREANLVLAPKIKMIESEYLHKGDTFNMPGVNNVTPSSKAESSPVSFIAPTETPYTLTVDQHVEVSFFFEDLLQAQTSYDLPGEYEKRAGYSLAEYYDAEISKLYSGFSTTDVGTAATAITKPVMLAAQQTLHSNNVPIMDRCFVFHTDNYDDIMGLTSLTTPTNVGMYQQESQVRTGMYDEKTQQLLKFYNDPVYISTNIQQTISGSTTNHNLYFHRDAFIGAKQIEPTVVTQYHADYLGYQLTAHEAFGVDNLRADHGVEVLS